MTLASFKGSSPLAVGNYTNDEVLGLIKLHAGELPQIELAYESAIKTLWITLAPEPRPVFTLDMMTSLNKVQRAIHALWSPDDYARSPIRFVSHVGKASSPVVTLGGDLEFYIECLAKSDLAGLEEYARISIENIKWNASSLRGAAITTASVHALALGGGIDAPRSCNVMIAERRASFSYPEIKFNHFPISAVAVLSRVVGPRAAQEILTSGKEYSAEEFARFGALDAVVDDGGGADWLRRYATENLKTHRARLALFRAFYEQSSEAFEEEMTRLAKHWTDHIIHLTPLEISALQKIVSAQDMFLSRLFKPTAQPKTTN
ncbi:crotonase/enoyl-CoA hydratase family protein [Rhodoblastus sp.]|uniref:crotonase/enoyl-CoA hydratase family protein n=1 Tax=Rhodoblastus sp. TaxID=1962975 RepID=UPI00260FFABA|nr:crotonase/enoyl-CoA hydratase family protein [Rhodoblastus sp.]